MAADSRPRAGPPRRAPLSALQPGDKNPKYEYNGCGETNRERLCMTLKIDLTPELEQRLAREADRRGIPAETVTLELLNLHLPEKDRQPRLVSLLQSWIEGDAEEQRETGEYLIQALDEDRLSERKLFLPELKGTTW
jgi:hypothetical protein